MPCVGYDLLPKATQLLGGKARVNTTQKATMGWKQKGWVGQSLETDIISGKYTPKDSREQKNKERYYQDAIKKELKKHKK